MTNLRLRVLPRYPARITGTGGIMVEREDVDLIVSPDFGQLAIVPAIPDQDETFIQMWTRDVDTYSITPFSAIVDAAAEIIGGDIQPLSPALTSIAGLTTSANKMIYTTASDTYAVADLSPYARTLLDDTTAGAALTTLGMSAFVQTLIDDADATAFKTTLSLQNVSNTSDANKPVSTAQQTALDLKANLASPTFTGDPKAPTPTLGDNDTSIATTAFVTAAVAAAGNNVVAWVNFNGTGVVAIRASKNVSSITDGGVGIYTVNFASALADANYAGLAMAGTGASGLIPTGPTAVPTTTTFRIVVINGVNTVTDAEYVSFAAVR